MLHNILFPKIRTPQSCYGRIRICQSICIKVDIRAGSKCGVQPIHDCGDELISSNDLPVENELEPTVLLDDQWSSSSQGDYFATKFKIKLAVCAAKWIFFHLVPAGGALLGGA